MKNHPDDKPTFLCGRCDTMICDDCASIAAEYEFLYERQKRELSAVQDKLEKAEAEVRRWKRSSESYEHCAKIGYPEVIQGYIDYLSNKVRSA